MDKRIYIFTVFLILQVNLAITQQITNLSQFCEIKSNYNPAASAAEGYTSFNLLSRQQWIGFKGAPSYNMVSFQSRLIKKGKKTIQNSLGIPGITSPSLSKSAISAYVLNDRNGLIQRNGIQLAYAYHIRFVSSQLSFGVAANAIQFMIDKEKFHYFDDADNSLETGLTYLNIDFNFGVYYSSNKMYLGGSIINMTKSEIRPGISEGNQIEGLLKHFYFLGGYYIDFKKGNYNELAVLFKTSESMNYQAEFITRQFFRSKFFGGVSYRYNTGYNALIMHLGIKQDRLMISYAFDFDFNEVMAYSLGSHELQINYRLGDFTKRIR